MPDLKLDELQHGPDQPATGGTARQAAPGDAGRGRAIRALARRAGAAAAPGRLWGGHRLFIIVAAVSLLPRILAALAYRPAMLTADSFLYMQEAAHGTLGVIRPSGYSIFLAVLKVVPHPLLAVTTAQHLTGIAIAALAYGVLRHWGLPAWGATLAAVPVLFDAREIALESYILPDTLYTLAIMITVALLVRRATPRLWQCAIAGLLMAYVTVLRGNGLPLALIVAVYLLVRRVGWRVFTAAAGVFVLPVLGYVLAFHSEYGHFSLTESDGIFLWSRTTSFANCAVIKPPARLVPLCPNGSLQPPPRAPAWSVSALLNAKSPSEYLWAGDAWWRHDAHPGINSYNNKLGRQFALDAIKAQPLSYLRVSAENVMLVFLRNDRPHNLVTLAFTTKPHIPALPSYYRHDIRQYAGTTSNTHLVQPYGYFLFIYQLPVYFPGFVFLGVLVAGLIGMVRKWRQWGGPGALPWVLAALSVVLPALLTESLYRYTLTAIPLACVAAGLAFARPRRQPVLIPATSGPPSPQPGPPGPAKTNPGSALAGSGSAPADSRSAVTQPGAATASPGSAVTQPGSAQPGSARPDTSPATPRPESARPATPRPGSAAGTPPELPPPGPPDPDPPPAAS
ncbi:MAG TPA: hypothetical protein VH637_21145 [Streptosporangiaceae bacterium]